MADKKLNTNSEVQKTEEATAPAVADPAYGEPAVSEYPPEQAGPAEPGNVIISAEQINALMEEKRRRPGPRWKRQRRPVNRRPGFLRRSVLPLKTRKLKSRAVAAPLSLIRRSAPGRRLKRIPQKAVPPRAAPL